MQDIKQRIYALLGTYRPYTEAEIEHAISNIQRKLSAADISSQHLFKALNNPDDPVTSLELTIIKIKAEQARMDGNIDLARSLDIAIAYCAPTVSQFPNLPNGRVFIEKIGFKIYFEDTYNRYKNIIASLDRNKYVLILHDEAKSLAPVLEERQIPYIFLPEVEEKKYIFKYLVSNQVIAHGSTGRYIVERIGFLIHLSELFNHYKNVLNHLERNEYVLILYDEAKSLVPVLEEMQIPYIFRREVEENKYTFKYLVSNHVMFQGITGNWVIQEMGLKNIRFMYALGKSQWNFSDWNRVYDLILCFGPHQADRLSFCKDTKKIQVGYPRYDGFFKEDIDKNYWLKKLGCSPAKRTIVWLPTSGSLSSVKAFCSSIAALKSQYNIVVKPHPLSFVTATDEIELLKGQRFNALIDELIDNTYLFYIADYIFSDYGGTAFGAIYTDRNLLLLNVSDAENDDLTGIDSADIALRQSIININAENGGRLASILSDPQVWETQRQVRDQLRSVFFAPYYGDAAKITADVLKHLDQILDDQENSTALSEREFLEQEIVKREEMLQEIQSSWAWRFTQSLKRLKSLIWPQRNRK